MFGSLITYLNAHIGYTLSTVFLACTALTFLMLRELFTNPAANSPRR